MDDDDDDSSPHENSYFVNILNSDFTALALFWSTKISLACVYEQSDERFYIIRNFLNLNQLNSNENFLNLSNKGNLMLHHEQELPVAFLPF